MRSARAAVTLWRQRMPVEEIRAVLTADDPAVVRRYLELHRERLEEWVEDQRRQLDGLERAWRETRGLSSQWQAPLPSSTKLS